MDHLPTSLYYCIAQRSPILIQCYIPYLQFTPSEYVAPSTNPLTTHHRAPFIMFESYRIRTKKTSSHSQASFGLRKRLETGPSPPPPYPLDETGKHELLANPTPLGL